MPEFFDLHYTVHNPPESYAKLGLDYEGIRQVLAELGPELFPTVWRHTWSMEHPFEGNCFNLVMFVLTFHRDAGFYRPACIYKNQNKNILQHWWLVSSSGTEIYELTKERKPEFYENPDVEHLRYKDLRLDLAKTLAPATLIAVKLGYELPSKIFHKS